MAKTLVQVCIKSGRGLRRSSAFWKLQWYAVGWIDPAAKYCTGIVASATGNPNWNTGFSFSVASPSDQLSLQVEVYSREPVFLRETLLGSATVELKEFLDRLVQSGEAVQEIGSFQLRKKGSGKPVGFVDVSIRIWEDDEDPGLSCIGGEEGFHLGAGIELVGQGGHNTTPFQPNYYPHVGGGTTYPVPARPAGNVGFAAPVTTSSGLPPSSYISLPPAGRGVGPGYGFGVGAGAGAVAGGAVLYGGDFLPVPGVTLDGGFSVTTNLGSVQFM